MSNILKEKVDNAKLLVNLAYLRTEYSSQNTYFATMRIAFAFALVSAYTKSYHILGFTIILLLGGYLQYKFMGKILIDINELTWKELLLKMRELLKNHFTQVPQFSSGKSLDINSKTIF